MQESFLKYFGEEAEYHIFSPYRVCPLGAHVDHQHGILQGGLREVWRRIRIKNSLIRW